MSRKLLDFIKNNELTLIIGLTVISVFLWNTRLVFPIKLFVVLIHEISHAIMTILTGGIVKSIVLNDALFGSTQTEGGNLLLISSAGYLGSLIIGALLYLSGEKPILGKWITSTLSAVILISSIELINNGMIIFFSLVVSLLLLISPRYFNDTINSILLKFVGLTSIFYVLTDIKDDLLTISIRETDAQIVEYLTGIPALLIGFIWLAISILTLYLLLRYMYNIRNAKFKK